jgi:hypothetical protein
MCKKPIVKQCVDAPLKAMFYIGDSMEQFTSLTEE